MADRAGKKREWRDPEEEVEEEEEEEEVKETKALVPISVKPKKKAAVYKTLQHRGKNQRDVDWRKGKSLSQRGMYLLEKGLWSDCTFTVRNGTDPTQTFKCHKYVLALGSPFFEAMFFGPLGESSDIKLSDISPAIFKMMLRYMYGEVLPDLTFEQALPLGYAADKYLLDDLLQHCLRQMRKQLKPENVIKAFEFARLTDCAWLENDATEMMKDRTKDVLESDSFTDADIASLESLLDNDYLNVESEVILWESLVRWGRSECNRRGVLDEGETLRRVLDPLLSYVRFLTMSAVEFSEGPASSDILLEKESLAILMHIASVKAPVEMPDAFCTLRAKRSLFYDVNEREVEAHVFQLYFRVNRALRILGFEFSKESIACAHTRASVYCRTDTDLSYDAYHYMNTSPEGTRILMFGNSLDVKCKTLYEINFTFDCSRRTCFQGNLISLAEKFWLKNTEHTQAIFYTFD